MTFSALPAMLLFLFSIPVVMQYRILPINGTPYWLFGILFFALIGKILIDMYPKILAALNRSISRILLILILCIVVGGSTWTAIVDRHKIAPVWGTHDIILQLEAAMRYVIQGKNPYKETYFGTPVEMFRYDEMGKPATNPALYHFVMPPWYLLAPFPVYLIANRTVGYFDGRMVSLLLLAATLFVLWNMLKHPVVKEIAVIVTALSPATIDYFIEGRSDLFAFAWLILSLYLLIKKKLVFSAIVMALAVLSKQTIWFAFPVWLALAGGLTHSSKRISVLVRLLAVTAIVSALIVLPFFIWDARAFIDSVVLYLSAGGETGYPVSGYGFSMVLFSMGIIKGLRDYFPFTVFQLGFAMPILVYVSYLLFKKPLLSRFFVGYGIVLFIIWYMSRYFNNSHIAFLSSIFALGILFHYDETYDSTKRT